MFPQHLTSIFFVRPFGSSRQWGIVFGMRVYRGLDEVLPLRLLVPSAMPENPITLSFPLDEVLRRVKISQSVRSGVKDARRLPGVRLVVSET